MPINSWWDASMDIERYTDIIADFVQDLEVVNVKNAGDEITFDEPSVNNYCDNCHKCMYKRSNVTKCGIHVKDNRLVCNHRVKTTYSPWTVSL